MREARSKAPRRRQGGVIAIVVALALAVLIGFVGLALDGGRLYVNKTELQNGADACALAASYELAGAPAIPAASFVNAQNAGMLVASRNRMAFQGVAIPAADVLIEFGNSLAGGSWLTAGSNPSPDSKYVRCTLTEAGIAPWFMQVLGFGSQTVAALATASLANAQTNCGIPLGICSAGGAPTYGLAKGQWISGRFSSGGGSTGSFNWIDYSPPNGGERELADLLTGSGECVMEVSHPVGQPGSMGNSAAQAWNTRFGLYQSGKYSVNTAVPDFTGFSYTPTNWTMQHDALPDFLSRRAAHASYGATVQAGNLVTGLSISNAYNPTTTPSQYAQYGADRRLDVAPIVDCSGWAGSQTVPIQAWACILMLHPIASPSDIVHMEYEGLASDPTSPCATSGVVGGTGSVGPLVPGLVQ